MTILVTGGAGFIGSVIVKRLEAQGESVRILDNYTRKGKREDGVPSHMLWDIRDFDDVGDAVQGCDEVIHCAYINGTKNFYERPAEVLDVGVKGIVNLIDACKWHHVKKFTLLSSSEVCRYKLIGPDESIPLVIPDPFNPRYSYSAGKIISEMMCIHAGIFDKLTIVRPFNIFGPDMAPGHVIPDIMEQFERGEITIRLIGSGEESRSFCYIDDFVDGLMIAREHGGLFNVGRESEITIVNLVKLIGQLYKIEPRIITGVGLREGDVPRRSPDISKLRALGYNPKVSLLEGLKKCALSRNAKSAAPAT